MSKNEDPYWKLRPPPPTPTDELCSCTDRPPIMLQAHQSSNPLSCMACNREVSPERIGFSEALAEKLAAWQSFHDCFNLLWLDSGEFESWAKAQLVNPRNPVNRRGFKLVSELNAFHRAYYWWFEEIMVEESQRISRCPVCRAELTARYGHQVCQRCSIVVGIGE